MSQVNDTIWEYNGQTFELDLQDADMAERYEAAFEQMAADEKAMPKEGKSSELLRRYCQLYFDMFGQVFDDPDAPARLFGEKVSARACEEAYAAFLDFVRNQGAAARERRSRLVSKYSPNRAARRADK